MTTTTKVLRVASAVSALLTSQSVWTQERQTAQLEEVVVTAQKVEQSLIDVPLSISVVGANDLERTQAVSIQDYAKLVPGLQLTQATPGFGRLTLRGINTGGVASTVGVYVDETSFGSSSGLANGAILAGDFDTFDVARVEVLRGPQGTIYGASSLGGVLKYVTVEPQFDGFHARVRGTAETVEDGDMSYSGAAVVNMPVSDSVAIRASGFYRRVGGFIDSIGTAGSDIADDINDSTVSGGRASIMFKPSDAASLRISAFVQDIETDSSSTVDSDPDTGETLYGRLSQSQYVPEEGEVRYRLYNATGEFDLGFADLTTATSYGTLTQDFRVDFTLLISPLLEQVFGVPNEADNDQITRVKRFTQEVRLASQKNARFDWLLGAYYTDEKGLIDQNVNVLVPGTLTVIPGLPQMGNGTVDSKYKEYAAFANTTIRFGQRFDLTLGGRFSHNKQNEVQDSAGLLFGGASTVRGDSSEDVFTYSAAPKFKLNDRVALYARVAKGFRPGGPNALALNAPPGTPTSYDSDSIVSYEVGFKGENAARSVGLDMAVFHIDWKDIQLFARVNGVGINANASGAESDGIEAALTFRPTDRLRLSLNGAYTDAKLTEDTDLLLVGGRDGDRLPFTPETSYALNGDYEWPIGGERTAYVGASFSRLSKVPGSFDAGFTAASGRQRFLPSYETLDVRAGIEFGAVIVEAFGRNLTNDEGKTSSDSTAAAPLGAIATGVIRPRSFGVALTAEF